MLVGGGTATSRRVWRSIWVTATAAVALVVSVTPVIAAPTVALLKDVNPGAATSNSNGMERLGKRALFTADDGIHGTELWRTDGTKAGTKMVKDINPTGSSDPYSMRAFGGRMYFFADDGVHG